MWAFSFFWAELDAAGPEPVREFQVAADVVMEMNEAVLKKKIVREARKFGADLIGLEPVERWSASNELQPEYWPQTIRCKAQTVIALGVPMLLPIVESTPSINHTVLYDTTNIPGIRATVCGNATSCAQASP
jgi:hypothetical protein